MRGRLLIFLDFFPKGCGQQHWYLVRVIVLLGTLVLQWGAGRGASLASLAQSHHHTCTENTVHCTQFTVHCTLYIVHFTLNTFPQNLHNTFTPQRWELGTCHFERIFTILPPTPSRNPPPFKCTECNSHILVLKKNIKRVSKNINSTFKRPKVFSSSCIQSIARFIWAFIHYLVNVQPCKFSLLNGAV